MTFTLVGNFTRLFSDYEHLVLLSTQYCFLSAALYTSWNVQKNVRE